MKFGKRLLAEAGRRWAHSYIDYKQLKHAIKLDVASHDPRGPRFEAALRAELHKVAAFYVEKEEELGAAMARLSLASSPHQVAALLAELRDLRRFAALNHYAVVKAAKKRNRHLKAACGEGQVVAVRAVHILSQQYFFTSPKLAALSTQAEILAQELAPRQPPASEVIQEYQCPICLDLLRSPVLLTCAHRFCWGCLLEQCTVARMPGAGGKLGAKTQQHQLEQQQQVQQTQTQQQQQAQSQQQAAWDAAAADGGLDDDQGDACATFDCAVCRKAQLLNLDRLQVDPHLDAFLQKLQRQQGGAAMTIPLIRQASSSISVPGSSTIPLPVRPLSSSAAIAIPGSAAAAVAAQSYEMVVDAKPSDSTASLAEASELVEAAAAAAASEEAEAAAPEALPALVAAAAVSVAVPEPQPKAMAVELQAVAEWEPALLPPQRPEHRGRLVVCLDLDGTLVTTFTPKRAPMLPPGSISYVVGRGGKLNPAGVFVVERPGLGDFLRRIAPFSEVVLFTAGLEDYAAPICDAIEARYPAAFHHRLYRPATVAEDVYPCIKDLSRLGRGLGECVLVDDTPLAFFRQPDHGVPVLQFRGDMDDRMLVEAVAPLLESLHGCADVAVPLARRFNMQKWFQAQGLTPSQGAIPRSASVMQLKAGPAGASVAAAQAPAPRAAASADVSAAEMLRRNPYEGTLLVCDFDRTLVDFDTGERVCDELAPELTSLLSTMQMPANFVPVTNTVLSEMQRRGVSRDRLVSCLREMGREVPMAVQRMLQWSARRGMETVILSDCNSVFIGHILTGARLNTLIRQVITNQASFQRVAPPQLSQLAPNATVADGSSGSSMEVEEPAVPAAASRPPRVPSGFGSGWFFRSPSSSSLSSSSSGGACKPPVAPPIAHRLVIEPRHNPGTCGSHGCELCPSNLCKGAELAALRASAARPRRVIYC